MEEEAGADREKILDSMTVWLQKDKSIQTISCTSNRERWISIVANAMKHPQNDDDDETNIFGIAQFCH